MLFRFVDLNLKFDEFYPSPISFGNHHINREYFAVLHSGEGDGWDTERPSMSSILMFQGKIYLIDAGPATPNTLISLGIGINEIDVLANNSQDAKVTSNLIVGNDDKLSSKIDTTIPDPITKQTVPVQVEVKIIGPDNDPTLHDQLLPHVPPHK